MLRPFSFAVRPEGATSAARPGLEVGEDETHRGRELEHHRAACAAQRVDEELDPPRTDLDGLEQSERMMMLGCGGGRADWNSSSGA